MENGVYKIQSSIDPKYGATVYPYSVFKSGSGWFLHKISDGQALSPAELRRCVGDEVVDELTEECNRLHNLEDHGE